MQSAGMQKRRPTTRSRLTSHQVREVAVAAHCDPRTVRKFIAGLPVVSTRAAAIRTVLISMGLERLVPKPGRQR